MFRTLRILRNNQSILIVTFFGLLLVLGLIIFKDYGISWDESTQRNYGNEVFDFIRLRPMSVFRSRLESYGPVFPLTLAIIERIGGMADPRTIYLMRHFCTFFLFYVSVWFFYLLSRHHFQNRMIALLGCVMLVISPRIFADAFYNPVDLPLLSLFIISMYTIVKFVEQKTWLSATVHALATACTIDMRVVGILLPALTVLYLLGDFCTSPTKNRSRQAMEHCTHLAWYFLALTVFTIMFWPTLWHAPVQNFIAALRAMNHHWWSGEMLYLGKYVNGNALPWHYLPIWIIVTTPVTYLLFCTLGIASVVTRTLRWRLPDRRLLREWVFLLWLVLPIAAVIILRSLMYDSWRHHFFMYPALILLALTGMQATWKLFRVRKPWLPDAVVKVLIIGMLIVEMAGTTIWMVRNHPYQNVYFSPVIGGIRRAEKLFVLDYWGLSYKEGMEYIAATDPRPVIRIAVANTPGVLNIDMLPAADRARMQLQDRSNADYFLTNFRDERSPVPLPLVHAITVNGIRILGIFKAR